MLFAWSHLLAEANHVVRIDLAGDGTLLMRREATDALQAPGLPPFREILAKSQDRGVPVYICRPCADARGITDADLEGRNAQYTNGQAMAAAMQWATKVLVV
jgi:sulfur relay (sulfurtransferase) complex TusBCD TusD component (DsrE family)